MLCCRRSEIGAVGLGCLVDSCLYFARAIASAPGSVFPLDGLLYAISPLVAEPPSTRSERVTRCSPGPKFRPPVTRLCADSVRKYLYLVSLGSAGLFAMTKAGDPVATSHSGSAFATGRFHWVSYRALDYAFFFLLTSSELAI